MTDRSKMKQELILHYQIVRESKASEPPTVSVIVSDITSKGV
jgi:hypothetical protein